MTDQEAQALIGRVLEEGEHLIWAEAAVRAGPDAWLPAVGLTLFALLGGCLSVAAIMYPSRFELKRWQAAAFALVFSAAPALGAVSFWGQIIDENQTAYGITNRRVIIVTGEPWLQVRSFGRDDVMMIDRRGDTVSIDYGPVGRGPDRGYRTHLRGLSDPVAVELLIIEHVRDDPRS